MKILDRRVIAFVFLVFVITIMNFARYIWQFGSPETSPGYSPTPIYFWLARYSLIIIIFVIAIMDFRSWRMTDVFLYSVLFVLVVIGATGSEERIIHIAAFYLATYGALFLIVRGNERLSTNESIDAFNVALSGLAFFGFVFFAIQFIRYEFFGILPSHSHDGSVIIRYGSFLDDSLAFGVILPMFAGFFFYGLKNQSCKLISLVSVCLFAVLTGSLTAMATTAGYSVWLFRRNWRLAAWWLNLLFLLTAAFLWQFKELWQAKSGSIAGHMEGLSLLAGERISGQSTFAESGWILVYMNFGLLSILILWLFHVFIFFACIRAFKYNTVSKSFAGAVEGLNMSAFVASFNVPVLIMFPVYFLLAIFAGILFKKNELAGVRFAKTGQ